MPSKCQRPLSIILANATFYFPTCWFKISPYHIKDLEKSSIKQPCLTSLKAVFSIYKSYISKTHEKCIEVLHELYLGDKAFIFLKYKEILQSSSKMNSPVIQGATNRSNANDHHTIFTRQINKPNHGGI